jgi:hypothetical protein
VKAPLVLLGGIPLETLPFEGVGLSLKTLATLLKGSQMKLQLLGLLLLVGFAGFVGASISEAIMTQAEAIRNAQGVGQ